MNEESKKRIIDGNMECIMECRQFYFDVKLTDKTKRVIRDALERAYAAGYMDHMGEAFVERMAPQAQAQPRALKAPPTRKSAEAAETEPCIGVAWRETGDASASTHPAFAEARPHASGMFDIYYPRRLPRNQHHQKAWAADKMTHLRSFANVTDIQVIPVRPRLA